jgi:hypothetical protein
MEARGIAAVFRFPPFPLRLKATWERLRRHRRLFWFVTYAAAIGYVMVWAVMARLQLPLTPVADLDIRGYLLPAVSKLNGGAFLHLSGLNFLYPALQFLVLSGTQDYRAIALLQHLFGVLAGFFFILSWNRLFDLARLRYSRALHQLIGVCGAGVLLLSNIPIRLELRLRSDALCIPFQLLTLWLTLEFLHRQTRPDHKATSVAWACAALGSACLLGSFKPSFLFWTILMIAILSYFVIVSSRPRAKWWFAALAPIIVLAISLPEYFLRQTDPASRRYLTESLFAVHAKLIQPQIETDLRHDLSAPYSMSWLKQADEQLGTEIAHTHAMFPASFPSLGFQPDYLMNGSDVLFSRWAKELGGEDKLLQFLRYYYWRALLHRPRLFLEKFLSQFVHFYRVPSPAFSIHHSLPLAPLHFAESATALRKTGMLPAIEAQPAGRAYLAKTDLLSHSQIRIREGSKTFAINRALAEAFLPICLFGLLLAVGLLGCSGSFSETRAGAWLTIFLLLPNFTNTFSLSFLHTMDVDRYSQVQFGAALLAELWIVIWLLHLIGSHPPFRRRS